MVSSSEWWLGLKEYNSKLFPLQIIGMVIVVVLLISLKFKKNKTVSNLIKGFLASSMLLNGILFFIVWGARLASPLKYFQGSLFIVIGLLFVVDIFTNWTEFSFPKTGLRSKLTHVLLLFVMLYPIFGLIQGRGYTQIIYPATVPCASVSLALVLMSMSVPKVNKFTYILLLVWAIPFAPFIQIPVFGVYEDIIMFITGMYSLLVLLLSMRRKNTSY